MYHDQALYKEAGGGFTPWHTDRRYWPLETSACVTAWIPFHAVPMEQGPLSFAVGSQHLHEHRELHISQESEDKIQKMLTLKDYAINETPFELGEVSFHLGDLFHRATPNTTDTMRETFTVIYIDENMRLKPGKRTEGDASSWCPGIEAGEIINSELNPVIYSSIDI